MFEDEAGRVAGVDLSGEVVPAGNYEGRAKGNLAEPDQGRLGFRTLR
ncbi:hypothetical protein [Micromonospora musae]|nr:hypothetical protein [Micromonospora musae]